MTYAQLQFVKAEAAFRIGDQATALTAYTNGISAHIDWVNARNFDNNQSGRPDIAPTQISAAEKAAFLADPRVVPAVGALTLTHIMSQKYIAQWAWGHNEMWMDMRRYHYTDIDPASGGRYIPASRFPRILTPTTPASPCSESGRDTTRNTCGTEPPWTSSADSPWTTRRYLWITQP